MKIKSAQHGHLISVFHREQENLQGEGEGDLEMISARKKKNIHNDKVMHVVEVCDSSLLNLEIER